MASDEALRRQLLEYLDNRFGREFVAAVDEPAGVQTGERVLYRLRSGARAARRELSSEELDEMKRTLVDLARRTGGDESRVTVESPVSSGLPHPRLIDLPGVLLWDTDLRRFVESDDALPAPDGGVEWVLGVALLPSEKMLLYLDFTHAVVKAIFRASYDADGIPAPGEYADVRDRFTAFQERARSLKLAAATRSGLRWIKLVQVDREAPVLRSNPG
jgi:hypothetical protein